MVTVACGDGRVVLINADGITELGCMAGDMAHLISDSGGSERSAENFRIVSYSTAKGCAAAYFPETSVLLPLDSAPDANGTPTSKSVTIRLERAES